MKPWLKVFSGLILAISLFALWNKDAVKAGLPLVRQIPKLVGERSLSPSAPSTPSVSSQPSQAGHKTITASYYDTQVSPDVNRAVVADRQTRFAAYLDERMRTQASDLLYAKKMTEQALNAIAALPFAQDITWQGMSCTDSLCKVSVGFQSPDTQVQKEKLLRVVPSLSGGEAFVHRLNDTDAPTSVLYFSRTGKEFPWVMVP
jgi:hypothetical protein